MRTIKRSLTRVEKLANLARAKTMRADGVDIQIPEEWEETARSLDIAVGGGSEAMVFDLEGGSAAYAVWVRLVARRRVTLTDCRLLTAWDKDVTLMGYFDDREPLWRLGQLDFPRGQVLNMRIMNTLKFHHHDYMVEGMILFTGRPIPEDHHHGMTVPFTLVLFDQNENEIRVEAELFVDRTWKRQDKVARRKRTLRGPVELPGTCEPVFRPNLNLGPVPDPAAESLKSRVGRKEGEPEPEAITLLRRELARMRGSGKPATNRL
jgi:hypothetical protein